MEGIIRRPIVVAALTFITGDVISIFGIPKVLGWMAVIVFAVIYMTARFNIKYSTVIIFSIFLALGMSLGARALLPSELEQMPVGSQITFTGIVEKIKVNDNNQTVFIKNITINNRKIEDKKVILYVNAFEGQIGDEVVARGSLGTLYSARNPGEFDIKWFYKTQGVNVYVKGEILEYRKISRIAGYINILRDKFIRGIDAITYGIENGLIKSMLLGDKQELDKQVEDSFRDNGIAHILAISGLHLSIIGMSIYRILRRLGLWFLSSALITVFIIGCYSMLTGDGLTTIRAVIMLAVSLFANVFGRKYDILTSMGIAALVILFQYPLYITNVGFLMSFGALLGITLLCWPLNKLWKLRKSRFNLVLQPIVASVSITIFTAPIMMFYYYQINPYSVVANIVVVPLMSLVLIGACLGGIMAMIYTPLGVFFVGIAYYILKFYEQICSFIDGLPGSAIITGSPQLWQMIVYYIVLLVVVALLNRIKIKNWMVLGAFLSNMLIFAIHKEHNFAVYMLDVGQGQCIIIENRGKYIMVDCGSSDIAGVSDRRIIPCLKYLGISELEGVFITHFDIDHCNGLTEILNDKAIKINKLYGSGGNVIPAPFDESRIEMLLGGMEFNWRDMSIRVLNPNRNMSYKDSNTASLVMSIRSRKCSLLITGDITDEVENSLINAIDGNYDILQVAHHGSKYSNSDTWIKKINPKISLISCGINNSYGHPHMQALERLAKSRVLRTDISGEITVIVDDGRIVIETFVKE